MINDPSFIQTIIHRLKVADIDCIIFGGWAEELTGVVLPRDHKDLDLLYLAEDFSLVDKFIESQFDLREIKAKHFAHKRAFLCGGIMVELLLVQPRLDGFLTNFWNEYTLEWPPLLSVTVDMPSIGQFTVVHPTILNFYREQYPSIEIIRSQSINV